MSDMNQSDLVAPAADVAPAAEPQAPEQSAAEAQNLVGDTPAEALAPVAAATPEPQPAEATPVLAQQPSSASPTQTPEGTEDVEDETPVSLEDAARAVVLFVKAHRTVGDADLGAALADLEAALPAQES